MIKIEYKENICIEYYNLFKNKYFNEEKLQKISYENKFKTYSFHSLLCSQFKELEKIKGEIGEKNKNDLIKKEIKIANIFNYDKKKNIISGFFNETIKPVTCYYCNINFINTFSDSKREHKGYTLDHFFPKAKYPYLALSLHNLIPSCSVCNSTLKKEEIIDKKSPTSSQFAFDEKVKFKIFISTKNKTLKIKNEDDFDLHLKEDFSDEYKDYMNVFKLDERYQYHKYKVLEMIEKRKQYPDSRIKELAQITQRTEQEVKRDLFGDYLFKDGLHKRPLSKLIRDIAFELGLVSDVEYIEIYNSAQ